VALIREAGKMNQKNALNIILKTTVQKQDHTVCIHVLSFAFPSTFSNLPIAQTQCTLAALNDADDSCFVTSDRYLSSGARIL
jgi:hypothetical protein